MAAVVALVLLLLGSHAVDIKAAAPARAPQSGLREAAAKRSSELARAPDGSIATDTPLPVIHAHRGVNANDDFDPSSSDAPASNDGSSSSSSAGSTAPPSVSLWLLLAMTMVMALLSGVGALPYLFTGKLDPYWSGIANAVGCGVMLAASFDLLEESKTYSASLVLGGIVLGVLAMAYSQAWLSKFEDVSFSDLQGADARKAMLILGVMAAHAFGEGSGVGVSFSGPRGWAQGLLVTIAIGLHNIPEGMAVATIMVARGTPPRTALLWTLLSALPQGIVAVPSYVFVEAFSGLLPIALGFAAGCMIWIVFAELIPDALETAEHGHVATAATLSAAALQVVSMVIAKLERADGSIASPIAADLRVLLPDMLLLAPAFLAPAMAAAAAGCLLPSLPLSLGLSVGVGAWGGLAGLLGSLIRHRMARHTAVLWAAAGAAAAAALWRGLGSLPAAGRPLGRKDSDSEEAVAGGGGSGGRGAGLGSELGAAETGFGGLGGRYSQDQQHYQQHQHHSAQPGYPLQHQQVHELQQQPLQQYAYGQALPAGGHVSGAPLPNGATANGGSPPPGAYYGGSGAGSGAGSQYNSGSGLAVHATGVAVGLPGRAGGAAGLVERRNGGYGVGLALGAGPEGYLGGGSVDGGGAGGGRERLHCNGNCSCKDCDAKSDPWGGPLDLLPASERPRDCVRGGLVLGAMLALAAAAEAFELAGALLQHSGDASTLLLPLALRGIALGAGCVGIARAATGSPGWQHAAAAGGLLAAISAAAVGGLLLPLPLGRVAAEDIAFDATHGTAGALRAFASGGLLLAAVGYLWPAAAAARKPRRVQLGVSLGLGLCVAEAALRAALCAATPYCLAAAAQAAAGR